MTVEIQKPSTVLRPSATSNQHSISWSLWRVAVTFVTCAPKPRMSENGSKVEKVLSLILGLLHIHYRELGRHRQRCLPNQCLERWI